MWESDEAWANWMNKSYVKKVALATIPHHYKDSPMWKVMLQQRPQTLFAWTTTSMGISDGHVLEQI